MYMFNMLRLMVAVQLIETINEFVNVSMIDVK